MVDTVMMADGVSVGKALRDARKAAGLTQEELANRLRYTRPTIAMWESGKREPPVAAFSRALTECGLELQRVLPDEAAVDIKLNELLSLWKRMDKEQRTSLLAEARRQIYL